MPRGENRAPAGGTGCFSLVLNVATRNNIKDNTERKVNDEIGINHARTEGTPTDLLPLVVRNTVGTMHERTLAKECHSQPEQGGGRV